MRVESVALGPKGHNASMSSTSPPNEEISVELQELKFKTGESLAIPPASVTLIVGTNNSGKSVLLNEIQALSHHNPQTSGPPSSLTLSSVRFTKSGSYESLIKWLAKNGIRGRRPNNYRGNQISYRTSNAQLTEQELKQAWTAPGTLASSSPIFVAYQGAESRLQLAGGTGVYQLEIEEPHHPLHFLWIDKTKELRFNALLRRAFGFEISMNRYVHNIELKVGRPGQPDVAPPPSVELLREYSELATVQQQGDGVRSFVGLLLQVLVPRFAVTLIDEPEAFLHPPQASLLARYLVEMAHKSSQLVIATHSQDVVQGVLNAGTGKPVQIVRLTRKPGAAARPTFLSPNDVIALSRNTFMQNSNALNGLFHDGVILGEADADCHYYRAVVAEQYRESRLPDIIFTQVAGKARVAGVAANLRTIGVPVASILDFDILSEAPLLQKTVEAHGGDYNKISADVQMLQASVDDPAGPTVASVRQALGEATSGLKERDRLDSERAKRVADALRSTTGWRYLKRSGLQGISQGDPRGAAGRCLAYLQTIGIFVVPVGELERWHPDVAGKSNEWVTNVLEQGLHRETDPTRTRFIESIATFMANSTGLSIEPFAVPSSEPDS